MDIAVKHDIVAASRKAHDLIESAYRQHSAQRGESDWAEKQRLLLADMSLHLLQTALGDGELSTDALKRNLYAILTISEQFIPDQGLKANADQLYSK